MGHVFYDFLRNSKQVVRLKSYILKLGNELCSVCLIETQFK